MEKCYSNTGDEWGDFEEAIQTPCEDLKAGEVFELAEVEAVHND